MTDRLPFKLRVILRLLSARGYVAGGLAGAVTSLTVGRLAAEIAPDKFYFLYTLPGVLLAALSGAALLGGTGCWPSATNFSRRLWPLLLTGLYLFAPRPAPMLGALLLVSAIGLTLAQFYYRESVAHWAFGLAAGGGALIIYLASLMPAVLPGDSAEFQLTPYILGVPHPTGYPLWVLLGNLISQLPIGSVAYRLNLLSALAGALAVLGVWLAARALKVRASAAGLAALAFAVTPTMWEQSVRAEKYALNIAFIALTLWLLLKWSRTGRPAWLNLCALVYGLSLTHHRTMTLMAPAYALFILITDRTVLRPRRLLTLVTLAILPLSLYLVLPLLSSRNPPVNFLQPNTWGNFYALVLGKDYQGNFFMLGWGAVWPQLQQFFGGYLLRQFTWVGVLLAALGAARLMRRDYKAGLLLLTAWITQVFFSINYYVPNNYVYYLPTYALTALFMAAGLEAILRVCQDWIPAKADTARRRVPQLGGLISASLLIVFSLLPLYLWEKNSGSAQNGRAYNTLDINHEYVVTALNAISGPAYVVGDWNSVTALWYGQYVLGLAPQATIVVADPLENIWKLEAANGFNRHVPVYLTRPVPAAAAEYALTSAGPLVQLRPEPIQQSAPCPTVFGENICLTGFSAAAINPTDASVLRPRPFEREPFTVSGGETLQITLNWQALQAVSADDLISLELVDKTGHIWAQVISRPVGQAYATNLWKPGESLADYHRLTIGPFIPSGEYSVRLRVGPLAQKEGLPVKGGRVNAPDQLELLRVRVAKSLQPALPVSAQPGLADFANALQLIGVEIPEGIAPGDAAQVVTYWQAVSSTAATYTATVRLNSMDESAVAIQPPEGGWRAGEVFRLQHTLSIPAQTQAGAYPLQLSLTDAAGQPLLVQPGWAQLAAPSMFLAVLNVESLPPAASNFSNQIRLRDFKLDRQSVRPGERIKLTLEWQALKNIDRDYKVFVHVLPPEDGPPVAQRDNQPVNGTYPTSRWIPGERVLDEYNIDIPAEAAPGEYHLATGLYLEASMTRLPIVDVAGAVTGDRVMLATITVTGP